MEWLKEILPDAGRVVTDGIEERYLSDTLGPSCALCKISPFR